MARFKVKIDQLPEEEIDASDAREAARKVAALLDAQDSLRKLAEDGPIQIKRPDGTPWGRNLTIRDFRRGLLNELDDESAAGDGPVRPATP